MSSGEFSENIAKEALFEFHASVEKGYCKSDGLHSDLVCHDGDELFIERCSTTDTLGSSRCEVGCSDTSSECGAVETLMFFDWDDTLFPTTWLRLQSSLEKDAVTTPEEADLLHRLAKSTESTLLMAMGIGKVVIVTNAEEGWVEMCCQKFMPSLLQVLAQVDIISARSTYEKCSDDAAEWKRLAFAREVNSFYGESDQQRNIVSLGDSLQEQSALNTVCHSLLNCCGKSLKFLESPTLMELLDEHEFARACLLDVVEHNGDLDVEIDLDNSS